MATGAEELVVKREETNSVHYFRSVRFTDNCLRRHGNPTDSERLWGNRDGVDGTGYPMENTKAGQIHAAFEVIASLNRVDTDIQSVRSCALGFTGVSIVVCVLLSILILQSVRQDSRTQAAQIGNEVVQKVSDGTAGVASAIEQLSANIRDIADGTASASGFAREVVGQVASTNARGTVLTLCLSVSGFVVLVTGLIGLRIVRGTIAPISERASILKRHAVGAVESAQSIAAAVHQLEDSIREIHQNTDEAEKVCSTARNSVQVTSDVLRELSTSSNQIDEVIELIR